jgi:hypothetical protein
MVEIFVVVSGFAATLWKQLPTVVDREAAFLLRICAGSISCEDLSSPPLLEAVMYVLPYLQESDIFHS